MRLFYNSYPRKVVGFLRFLWLRLWRVRRLKAVGPGLIGRRCGFYILPGGSAELKGKFALNDGVMVYVKGRLEVGKNLYVNRHVSIVAHERITIGDNVSIGQFTTILDHDHAYQKESDDNIRFEGFNEAPITIGNNVWIANHCTVVRGVTIGNNVIVGANTLVHKDVPDNCIIMGVPYKIIKKI